MKALIENRGIEVKFNFLIYAPKLICKQTKICFKVVVWFFNSFLNYFDFIKFVWVHNLFIFKPELTSIGEKTSFTSTSTS